MNYPDLKTVCARHDLYAASYQYMADWKSYSCYLHWRVGDLTLCVTGTGVSQHEALRAALKNHQNERGLNA